MNEALSSILCGEEFWTCDEEGGNTIEFNENGTGELHCHAEFSWWICAEFEWKIVEPLDQIIDLKGDDRNKSGTLLGQLNIEITLTTRQPLWMKSNRSTALNEKSLTDDAFLLKTYTVRLEKGNFISPGMTGVRYGPKGIEKNVFSRYVFRLLFDKSPYPPRSEWKHPRGGPDSNHFWERKEFVGRRSQELEEQAEKWNRCAIS